MNGEGLVGGGSNRLSCYPLKDVLYLASRRGGLKLRFIAKVLLRCTSTVDHRMPQPYQNAAISTPHPVFCCKVVGEALGAADILSLTSKQ